LTIAADEHRCTCAFNAFVQEDRGRWAPADYAELAQPIADFLYECLLKFQDKRARLLAGGVAECAAALERFCTRLEAAQQRAPLHAVVLGRVADIGR
jgi:hypothetical protein